MFEFIPLSLRETIYLRHCITLYILFSECSGTSTDGQNQMFLTNSFWTSGRRISDSCNSSFIWKASIDQAQSLAYTNWLDGEPNCFLNRPEYCLAFRKDGVNTQWNDVPCNSTLCSVCDVVQFQH